MKTPLTPSGPLKRHCRHCGRYFALCKYNRPRQRYCTEPGCRAASHRASNDNWRARNRQYFRGSWNVARVRTWRLTRWIRGAVAAPLQDSIISKALEVVEFMPGMAMGVLRRLIEESALSAIVMGKDAGLSPA